MRLQTIWTLQGMPMLERFWRTVDWSAMTLGAHLPLRVRYWTTMQELGKATRTSPNVPATPLDEILQNLQTPKRMS